MNVTNTCETCPFWTAGDPKDPKRLTNTGVPFGDCRRYPLPGPVLCGVTFRKTVWTLPNDWCGEHPERR